MRNQTQSERPETMLDELKVNDRVRGTGTVIPTRKTGVVVGVSTPTGTYILVEWDAGSGFLCGQLHPCRPDEIERV